MKLVRSGLALGAGVALVLSGPAGAAPKPKPVCNLVVDPAGDGTQGLASASNQPAWDILSADVATDKTRITTVIRVAKLSKVVSDDPVGSQWRFDFVVGTVKLYTQATSTPFGDAFIIGYTDSTSHGFPSSGATGVFDLAKNEVRVSAPLAATTSQATIKPGTKLASLAAQAGDYINTAGGPPSASLAADTATGTKTYAAGTLSCVVVGK